MKKYFYEFIGYLCFYYVAKNILDINVYLSFGLGFIGSLIANFFYKLNRVFFDRIETTSFKELNNNYAEFEIEFRINHKRKPYHLKGTFITFQGFETESLNLFLYNNFTEKKFNEVMKFGNSKMDFKDNNHSFEIIISK
jgi:hypothetical protein